MLFSQKIGELANENNKPRDMTANARGWAVGKQKNNLEIFFPFETETVLTPRALVRSSKKKIKRLWTDYSFYGLYIVSLRYALMFVKPRDYQGLRESIPHTSIIPQVVPLRLFLDRLIYRRAPRGIGNSQSCDENTLYFSRG